MTVGNRRILVIGSQCNQIGKLSFLPQVAEDLYTVMTDAELGCCEPALPGGGLVLDPSVTEATDKIKEAFASASRDQATLVIAFVGHGVPVGRDFYFLPLDGASCPDSQSGIHLVQLIKEQHRKNGFIDGLVILLDACYAGVAAADASAQWVGELSGSLRFEVLAAVEAERTAADGCFTRNLVGILRNGIEVIDGSPIGANVRCEHAYKLLVGLCKRQKPRHPTNDADEGLFLAKNAAHQRRRPPWFDTSSASEIERLTTWFQATPQLDQVVSATQVSRCVALFGEAGTGKSALAAALAKPEVAAGEVPASFVQAVIFISEAITSGLFADDLARQLHRSLPDFETAVGSFRRSMTKVEWDHLDAVQRQVVGPLRWLKTDRPVCIVVDGLDRLPAAVIKEVYDALDILSSDPHLPWLHLFLTARPGTAVPAVAGSLTMSLASAEDIRTYLTRRQINPHLHDSIIGRAHGNWLVAKLLADLASADPAVDPDTLPADLAKLYQESLHRAGAVETKRWRAMLRPVMGVLAAAGVGPVLPFKLLCVASGELGGPDRPTPVHDILFDLRGFVARSEPGTDAEQVGLFHQTFAEFLFGPASGPFTIDPQEPNEGLAKAIDALAPMDRHDLGNPLHRYAAAREFDHLWQIQQYERSFESLIKRASVQPAENLSRWKSCYEKASVLFGPEHPFALATRGAVAKWTLISGDVVAALSMYGDLSFDFDRLLGPKNIEAVLMRADLAYRMGEAGDIMGALSLLRKILPVIKEVLGPDHPNVLTVRNNLAKWEGLAGNEEKALRIFSDVLCDRERILGPEHPETLTTRHSVAWWTKALGDIDKAIIIYRDLLKVQEKGLGPEHPETLFTRANLASCIGLTGDAITALRSFETLLPIMERILGPEHLETLEVRFTLAFCKGAYEGGLTKAVFESEPVVEQLMTVYGPRHYKTLKIRQDFALIAVDAGMFRKARSVFNDLLPDLKVVFGSDNPKVYFVEQMLNSLRKKIMLN